MTERDLKSKMLKEESRIHNEIRKIYPNAGLDGIIDIDCYLGLKNPICPKQLKILWILKERGYPSNKQNQEFFIKDCMLYLADYSNWMKTYGNMCYVTEGILEWQRLNDIKYLDFNNLPKLGKEEGAVYYINNKKQFFPLDYIAFLNVKKLGTLRTNSKQREIDLEYEKPEIKKILKEQFDYINPDIIIFGNHVEKLAEDFANIPLSKFTECGNCTFTFDKQRKKLFIFTDHPNARKPAEYYCNSIFNAIKQNMKELLNIYN